MDAADDVDHLEEDASSSLSHKDDKRVAEPFTKGRERTRGPGRRRNRNHRRHGGDDRSGDGSRGRGHRGRGQHASDRQPSGRTNKPALHDTSYAEPQPRRQDSFVKRPQLTEEEQVQRSQDLLSTFKSKRHNHNYLDMLRTRRELPAFRAMRRVMEAVQSKQVVIVSGATGCGKTTQVPQLILDDALIQGVGAKCNIICTQPRRLSAIGVAQRVADERCESLGASVGYQIRLESKASDATQLLYCTTGILLRRLESDPLLEDVSHVVVDEVHERSLDSDLLLLFLREMMVIRTDLKVILMSATLNAETFATYFGDAAIVDIEGRSFPVTPFYLEDALQLTRYEIDPKSIYAVRDSDNRKGPAKDDEEPDDQLLTFGELSDRYPDIDEAALRTMYTMNLSTINYELLAELIQHLVLDTNDELNGSILVFLPGFAEITAVYDAILEHPSVKQHRDEFWIVPLHSSLNTADQNKVFELAPEGSVKVVLSTNIAETSITIDDCVCVIDTGRMKELRYDAKKHITALEDTWVSKANALQRRGRAGRTQPGKCYHMFTSHKYREGMPEQQEPEIKRVPLEQLILRVKSVWPKMLGSLGSLRAQLPLADILQQTLDPPSEAAVNTSAKVLKSLDALDDKEVLTPLGQHLVALPVDARIGKLMLLGAMFQCLDPVLTIAASASVKSPFVQPFSKREEARKRKKEFSVEESDLLTVVHAYNAWQAIEGREDRRHFCQDNFISNQTMKSIAELKQQLAVLLCDLGFVPRMLSRGDFIRAGRESNTDGVLESLGPYLNQHRHDTKVLKAIIASALAGNIVHVSVKQSPLAKVSKKSVDDLALKTRVHGKVAIHPSSINYKVARFSTSWLAYLEVIKTREHFVRDTTSVSPLAMLLFGGEVRLRRDYGLYTFMLDNGWIRFVTSSKDTASCIMKLREGFQDVLYDKIKDPTVDVFSHPILRSLTRLVTR
eukprot:TRINITY_DN9308_c0_g1_i3.p1 TRINITY_DN9308_c0_g1~~TRINITY_DN9308_c0_g1_i3.p1  ORF type:complete len:1030 (+),score=236.99 TRINITY_DN9308_c0_g1_i3:221-3091(+)